MATEDVRTVDTADINRFVEYEATTTRWYYLGEDKQEHGPYSNTDMMRWVDSGYFGHDLLIRTEREDNYSTLYAYIKAYNGLPFNCDTYNRSTPLPVHYPVMILQQPPGMVQSSQFPAGMPQPNQLFVNSNGFSVPTPTFLNGQQGIPNYGSQNQGYGIERENPSSSSVSDSPDIDRCSQVDDIVTYNKCVGTEDAPWLKSTKVDSGTDAPIFDVNMTTSYTQTQPIMIKSSQVSRLLKELTGVNFYVR